MIAEDRKASIDDRLQAGRCPADCEAPIHDSGPSRAAHLPYAPGGNRAARAELASAIQDHACLAVISGLNQRTPEQRERIHIVRMHRNYLLHELNGVDIVALVASGHT